MLDVFEQVKPTEEASKQIAMHNYTAERMLEALSLLPDSREKSLAITKLEECVMWANKCAVRKMR